MLRELCRVLPGGELAAHPPIVALADGDVYQFGVARGRSLAKLLALFGNASTTWGFDTFTGMPRETRGEPTLGIWGRGHFSAGGPAAANASRARAVAAGAKLHWVVGDYATSLTPTLAHERAMRPARYVDLDCDLYRSSHLALHWVFASGLATVGTVIGYDDLWDLPCARGPALAPTDYGGRHVLAVGEGKAHAEVAARFGVRFRCVCGPCMPMPPRALLDHASWRAYFVVESVCNTAECVPDTGFSMTDAQAQQFWTQNARCKEVRRRHALRYATR